MSIWRIGISVVGGLICGALFWPTVDHRPLAFPGRRNEKPLTCMSAIKQLALANLLYSAGEDDVLPNRDLWMDQVLPRTKNPEVIHCPSVVIGYGYAFNSNLSNKAIPANAENTPLVYDSINQARNASDPFTSLPNPGRHNGENTVAYADAHARALRPK